jgi:hypothetical protein
MFWISYFWVVYVTADGAFPLFQLVHHALVTSLAYDIKEENNDQAEVLE